MAIHWYPLTKHLRLLDKINEHLDYVLLFIQLSLVFIPFRHLFSL